MIVHSQNGTRIKVPFFEVSAPIYLTVSIFSFIILFNYLQSLVEGDTTVESGISSLPMRTCCVLLLLVPKIHHYSDISIRV